MTQKEKLIVSFFSLLIAGACLYALVSINGCSSPSNICQSTAVMVYQALPNNIYKRVVTYSYGGAVNHTFVAYEYFGRIKGQDDRGAIFLNGVGYNSSAIALAFAFDSRARTAWFDDGKVSFK